LFSPVSSSPGDVPDVPVYFRDYVVGGERVTVRGQPIQMITLSPDIQDFPFDPNGDYPLGHAYVQVFTPQVVARLPIVLVHGGAMSGSIWGSTPDGRPGWATVLAALGSEVHVVDLPTRGRAGWCPAPGVIDPADRATMRHAERVWVDYRIGSQEGFATGEAFPCSQFPLAHFWKLVQLGVPRWVSETQQMVAALREVVRAVGRCVLIGVSQGGGLVAQVAAELPDLVAAAVLMEPHGLPQQVTAVPGPQLLVQGDHLQASALFRGLVDVWASYTALVRGRCPGRLDVLDLPAVGHHGNSHVMMMDANSVEVATLVTAWLSEVIDTRPAGAR
jgi:pimeloyl-ACP methyl ester carboxylesterase